MTSIHDPATNQRGSKLLSCAASFCLGLGIAISIYALVLIFWPMP